jgi:hypothetical protein
MERKNDAFLPSLLPLLYSRDFALFNHFHLSTGGKGRRRRRPEMKNESKGTKTERSGKRLTGALWMAERLVTLPAKQLAWVRFPVPARPLF